MKNFLIFSPIMDLPSHEKEKTKSKRKRCDTDPFNSSDDEVLCSELDSTERKLKKFKQAEDYFLCDVCGKQLKHRQSFQNHFQSHVSSFACECGKVFKHKRNLATHQKRCLNKQCTFNCNQCNCKFN